MEAGLQKRPGKICRWCSWAGFVTFKNKTDELPYANEGRGKPD